MKAAWRYARDTMRECSRPWAKVKGPASASWASLTRIGWEFIGPFAMRSDEGVEYEILHISPTRVLRRLREAGVRWGWRKVFRSKGVGEAEASELAKKVRTARHRKALFGKHDAGTQERGALRAVMDNSVCTEARCCNSLEEIGGLRLSWE